MGNVTIAKLKEDKCLDITEELEQVSLVDRSVSGFAKSLDSLRASCELLLRQMDKQDTAMPADGDKDRVQNVNRKLVNEAELAVHMLRTMDDSVSDQKVAALQSLTNLLHFIIDIGKGLLDIPEENQPELSLDNYITKRKKDTESSGLPYHKTRTEDLRKELSLMSELYEISKDEIKVLNKKETDSREERDTLRKEKLQEEQENKRLKAQIEKMKSESNQQEFNFEDISPTNDSIQSKMEESMEIIFKSGERHSQDTIDKSEEVLDKHVANAAKMERWTLDNTKPKLKLLSDENESLKSSKNALEMKLEKLYSKQCVHVQCIATDITKTVLADITKKLKEEMKTPTTELYIVKRNRKTELDGETPALVFCSTIHGPPASAKEALKGVKKIISVMTSVGLDLVPNKRRPKLSKIEMPWRGVLWVFVGICKKK